MKIAIVLTLFIFVLMHGSDEGDDLRFLRQGSREDDLFIIDKIWHFMDL